MASSGVKKEGEKYPGSEEASSVKYRELISAKIMLQKLFLIIAKMHVYL